MPETICSTRNASVEVLLYDVRTVAKMLSVSECTVRSLTSAGTLACTKIGDRVLYTRKQLDRFISKASA